jgi:hypothetical protein
LIAVSAAAAWMRPAIALRMAPTVFVHGCELTTRVSRVSAPAKLIDGDDRRGCAQV